MTVLAPSEFLNVRQAAEYLGILPVSIRQAVFVRTLPVTRIKVGGATRLVFTKHDLDIYRDTKLGKLGRPRKHRKGER